MLNILPSIAIYAKIIILFTFPSVLKLVVHMTMCTYVCVNCLCFPGGPVVKNQSMQEMWVRSWVGEITWSRKWQLTPVFLLVKFHGMCSPWGHKELDMTEYACCINCLYPGTFTCNKNKACLS